MGAGQGAPKKMGWGGSGWNQSQAWGSPQSGRGSFGGQGPSGGNQGGFGGFGGFGSNQGPFGSNQGGFGGGYGGQNWGGNQGGYGGGYGPPQAQSDHNPYMNQGSKFSSDANEAAYWGNDMSQYNPQYDQWSAGKSAYEDRLQADSLDETARRKLYAENLMSPGDYEGDLEGMERAKQARWANQSGNALEDQGGYMDNFLASEWGQSDLDKQRSDEMSRKDAYWKWQQDMANLQSQYGNW